MRHKYKVPQTPNEFVGETEKFETGREAQPWIRDLIALARAYNGIEFRKKVLTLVDKGQNDPSWKPVSFRVVSEVGKAIPEIQITLKAILIERENKNGSKISGGLHS
jgi:hypothetical protein